MHPLPVQLAADLARRLDLGVAVETGTYLGDSAALLSRFYPEVWTIELSEKLHAQAKERHRSLVGVHFLLGSSAEILPKLVGEIGQPALYWLDGHWTADSTTGSTAGEERQCPVMEEIAAIDAYDWGESACILIDDARLYLGPPGEPYRRDDWPSFIEVVDQLRARFPRFVTVLEDVIIAGPPRMQPVVDDYWLGVLQREEDTRSQLIRAMNPPAGKAARQLAKAVLPPAAQTLLREMRQRVAARRAGSSR